MFINDRFAFDDEVIKFQDRWIKFRKRTRNTLSGDVNIRVGVWNLQSLSRDINQRYKKIEFIRDTLNENKFDFIWLIDVNDHKAIIINGYKKFTDNRSVLFVKDEFLDEFEVYKNCIFSRVMKLAFVYITPSSKDKDLLNNIRILLNDGYSVFGDFNLKSNKDFAYNNVFHFTGEDTCQIGAISKKIIRTVSIAAPSDHRFVIFNFRNFANLAHSLKIGEIDYKYSKECVFDILNGKVPVYKPKVWKKQYRLGLNDRELSINSMIDDYLNNNVRKLFKRYNFLWKYDRREPFLGKSVPDSVKVTYAVHLKENVNKEYVSVPNVHVSKGWLKNLLVQKTASMAVNHEFISLANITKAVNEFLLIPENKDIDVVNNVIKVANEMREDMNAEVFFLQKNKIIKDFNDVRVIVIIPTIIKIYESLIFSKIMNYLSKKIYKKRYQFGGIIGGSTYKAMLKMKLLCNKGDARGLVLLDMSKGYDTVNLEILEKEFDVITKEDVKGLLIAWVRMIKNMNVVVNDQKIKRTRGIPMGLSLSPIVFVFYVQRALADIDKSYLSMYLDDLAIVFPRTKSTFLCVALVDRIIEDFAKFDLVINEKKTVFMSIDKEIIDAFGGRFKKIDEAKFLGRLVSLNGDGKVVPDDRYYNLKAFRSSACCYWATFFVKRLVFNAALDAKFRYRLLMWATTSRDVRTSVWVNNWNFFRRCMGSYSYLQLTFATFNVLRYFIDIVDVLDWHKRWNESSNNRPNVIKEIKDKLLTGIDKVDNVVNLLKPDLSDFDLNDEFESTKCFLNDLWNQFKHIAISNYKKEKKLINFETYENLEQFCFSKLFNYFGVLQQVVLIHFRRNLKRGRVKELFLLTTLNALLEALNKSVIYSFYNFDDEASMVDIDFQLFADSIKYIYDEKKIYGMSIPDFEDFMIKELKSLWPLADIILDVFTDAKRKGEANVDEINQKLSKYDFVAYVDGSAKENKIGYAGVIYNKLGDMIVKTKGQVEGKLCKKYRNISGEFAATLGIMRKAIDLKIPKMCLVFDYYGIQKYATGEWIPSNPVAKEYVISFKTLAKEIEIEFFKIASHTGLPGNELVDKMAKQTIGIDIDSEKADRNGPIYPQEKIDYLKKNFRIIFKILTVIEMIYLNNNLNNCCLVELVMNFLIKFNNLDNFTDKSYRLATLEDNLDPLDDNFVDIINDIN